jgi:murein DD-endopeptidase MepM/ murein hydrolase activator NlpD
MRKLGVLLVLIAIVFGAVYVAAGWSAGPAVTIAKPEKFVGAATPLEITIDAPGGVLGAVEAFFEQGGKRTILLTNSDPAHQSAMQRQGDDRVVITRIVGKETVPDIASGPARIVVTATRPVLYGLRQIAGEAARDVEVRLERPRVSVLSTHHYINHGGSEMVMYRVSPTDVQSGVMVGDVVYPGFAASGAAADGVQINDPAVRVAFFALRHDQALTTPMYVFARDQAGNMGRADFDFRVFPKPFKKSRIEINDKLLERVVPTILAGTTEVRPSGSLAEQFVVINSELRRKNAEKIQSLAAKTAPEMLWRGTVFHSFTNTSAESAFADQRTYVYQGREIDKQVHLGFDLASFAGTPIVAANRGSVLLAEELGIYGQCVILDHGMGVQSLYAHLSSIGVQPGTTVDKGQELGRSGMTGLAGGDHLHFTMLVNGQMVNPIEWWDSHWIQDRIIRKLKTPW